MKKNGTMQGTLNKLFGKKPASNNSLYANNPPWILPQGTKKASVDYNAEVHNSFAFLDDSGTATLKSRPGPRARPVLQLSTNNTETQGLAVPTPSIPAGFTDNSSIGNGSKMNGNYRMCSSVGDLRYNNYYDDDNDDDDLEEIPAPPSMPPPPPPSMPPPPPPPQQSPPSSAISSPSSPSPPDFIPPTPNSSAPVPPKFLPTDQSAAPAAEQPQTNNVTKWKSDTGLHAVSKDLPMTLPNRFSLNPAAFQHHYGQTNLSGEPQSTLPRSFKVPPPAPTRTSSIQLQEPQSTGYSKDPPQSQVPSSFNPSFQAKLYTANQRQQSLNDTLNKRKSMLIMEDLSDLSESSDQKIEKSANVIDSVSSRTPPLKDNRHVLKNPNVELNKEIKNVDAINDNQMESASILKEAPPKKPYRLNNVNEFTSVVPEQGEERQKYSQNGTERNTLTLNKRGHTQEINKTSKPTVQCISIKPILSDLSLSNSNGSRHDSLSRNFPQELTSIDMEVKPQPERGPENLKEWPPTPPPKAPPPPPITVPPNQQPIAPPPLPIQNITPPKTPPVIHSAVPPPAPPFVAAPVVRMPSPLLSPKPKTIQKPPSLVVPPPPKAPPAPPPLPGSVGPSGSVPLLEALQAKQQTLRKIPKSIEVRPAQTSSIPSADNEQKIRVGKIKGELEALFSPKKDEKADRLKNSRLEASKNSSVTVSQPKGGENKLVNSLMLKVPLLPAKFERDDVDADNSEWLPKSNKMDIQIPEPDYSPESPIHKPEKPTYSEAKNKIPKATLDISVPPPPPPIVSPKKDTNTAGVLARSIPTYKPHHERKVSNESNLEEIPVVASKPDADVGLNVGNISRDTEIALVRHSVSLEPPLTSEAESTVKHPVTGEKVEANSPMALLMAAQKRAQKAKSLDRGNLPKISVTSAIIKSSSSSPYNERRANTFVVVPNKETIGKFTQEEVTSFTSNSNQNTDSLSDSSTWGNGELHSDTSSTLSRNSDGSNDQFSVPYVYNSADLMVSTHNRNEDYLKPKSTTFDNQISVPSSTESPTFNISSFPSPITDRKIDKELEYGIIPPPAEFMNSPVPSFTSSMQHENRSDDFDYGRSRHSDLIPNYDRNNSVTQPFAPLSTTSNTSYNSYSSDYSNTAQKGSLIKRRLYMPEPESTWSYGKNTSSLRSSTIPASYGNMHVQSSSSMGPDPRRSNTMSRYLSQGRREYSENMNRIVPPMTDQKYISQNSDYSAGKSSTRSQNKLPQGMTFTVRPGTRQPISQMYQGGYL